MTVEDSKKLLAPEFYPSWVVFSQRQKVSVFCSPCLFTFSRCFLFLGTYCSAYFFSWPGLILISQRFGPMLMRSVYTVSQLGLEPSTIWLMGQLCLWYTLDTDVLEIVFEKFWLSKGVIDNQIQNWLSKMIIWHAAYYVVLDGSVGGIWAYKG